MTIRSPTKLKISQRAGRRNPWGWLAKTRIVILSHRMRPMNPLNLISCLHSYRPLLQYFTSSHACPSTYQKIAMVPKSDENPSIWPMSSCHRWLERTIKCWHCYFRNPCDFSTGSSPIFQLKVFLSTWLRVNQDNVINFRPAIYILGSAHCGLRQKLSALDYCHQVGTDSHFEVHNEQPTCQNLQDRMPISIFILFLLPALLSLMFRFGIGILECQFRPSSVCNRDVCFTNAHLFRRNEVICGHAGALPGDFLSYLFFSSWLPSSNSTTISIFSSYLYYRLRYLWRTEIICKCWLVVVSTNWYVNSYNWYASPKAQYAKLRRRR